MRNSLVKEVFELAKSNPNVYLLTGDLGFGVLNEFFEKLPGQVINMGIAEQNMTSVAAGMALDDCIPFTYSIGNFSSLKCIEQIRNDICYHNLNVKIVSIGVGMAYGAAGVTHHMTEDISAMRALPNLTIFSPSDPVESALVTKMAFETNGPCYIRIGKGNEAIIHHDKVENLKLGDPIEIQKGIGVCFFTTGSIIEEVMKACSILKESNIDAAIYSFPVIKPLNKKVLKEYIQNFSLIVTVEEHVLNGGFGSIISEIIVDEKINMLNKKLLRIGIDNEFTGVVGNQKFLRNYYGVDAKSIVNKVKESLPNI